MTNVCLNLKFAGRLYHDERCLTKLPCPQRVTLTPCPQRVTLTSVVDGNVTKRVARGIIVTATAGRHQQPNGAVRPVPMTLLIDGHNLIGVLPGIDLADPDDEVQLIHRLQAYHGASGRRMIVFFDSGDMPGAAEDRSTRGVAVRFARRPQTADDLIVAFLRKSQQPGQHAVVSNDRALAEAARRLGASVLTASRFADQMQAAPRPAPMPHDRHTATPDPRDPAFVDLYADFLGANKDRERLAVYPAHDLAWWQEQLYGDDVVLAEDAVRWLRRFADRRLAIPLLMDALTHSHAGVRAAAALALGELAAGSARPALVDRLANDPSSMVREAAAQALGRIGGASAIEALQAARQDPKSRVRKTADAMLRRLLGAAR